MIQPTRALPPPPLQATVARVIVCDDSLTIRGAIARMLDADPGIQVVARVSNGQAALDEVKRTPADVWCWISKCR